MDQRRILVRDTARAAGLSMSTIHRLRRGHNPSLLRARLIAGILDMSEADVRVIAGLDDRSAQ
ncbi:helix-turn-helix domain-containing protein [Streptomyces sp. IBSBF 2435]|uniref:helix-turn-helix domain-containing protein n=1 Tax=Streptomyces sp. IBSBF 2435 TaxID=2903531 RepID=UPI002FDBDDC0